jgi:hypothetical protein
MARQQTGIAGGIDWGGARLALRVCLLLCGLVVAGLALNPCPRARPGANAARKQSLPLLAS